jgi:DNA-binding transcriptional ArsR family regulator
MAQKAKRKRRALIDERLVKAISHPLRIEILVELDRAPMSPSEYATRYGDELSTVSYHFRELEKAGCLTIVEEAPRRGAMEHYYEVTKRALFTDEAFAQMPAPVRGGFNASIVGTFSDRALEAIEADTMDSRENKHLTWTPVQLDETGFDRIMRMLGDVYTALGVEQLASAERMKASGETTIHSTVAMFGFESPAPERKNSKPGKRP